MMKLALKQPLKRSLRSDLDRYDPYNLFGPNQAGFVNSRLRTDTVFTTNTGSTRVAAVGDSVGRIDNLIPSGTPDLIQSIAANRPTRARIPRGGRRQYMPSYSDDFSNAAWSKTNFTPTYTTTTGPDGVTLVNTALLTGNAGASLKVLVRASATTIVAGQVYTIRVRVKASTGTFLSFTWDDTTTTNGVWTAYNIQTGAITQAATAYGTGASAASSITSLGNSCYDLVLTGTAGTTATSARWALSLQGSGTSQFSNFDTTTAVHVLHSDIQIGSSIGNHQTITTSVDVTESGVPSIWIPYYDGGDFLTTGVQQFSAAGDLFADAASRWTVWYAFAHTDTAADCLLSKSDSTDASSTLQLVTTSGNALAVYLRGTVSTLKSNVNDMLFHVGVLRWDGTTARSWVDGDSATTPSVGSAAEQAQDIIVGARTGGTSLIYTGYLSVGAIDRALSDAEVVQLMAWMRNYYGTP